MDTWLPKWNWSGKLNRKVMQISLCQFHAFKHCKLQQLKNKPRLLKTQVIEKRMVWGCFDFWTYLSDRRFNLLSSQNVERWGISIPSRNYLLRVVHLMLLERVHLPLGFTSVHCLSLLPPSSHQSRSSVDLLGAFVYLRAKLPIS